ncbi:MAG TPA: O-antigen ligase family protein [Candidatus Bathyarchaeia archaeon]|jgi:O-antigen ligase|nr:O-antigen ligase family protein [Candidatus Bathyarchaeia archaeon]
MTSARIAPNLPGASVEWSQVAPRRESEAAVEPDPLAFSVARLLLVVALMGAPLAFGAVITEAWVALGLVASFSLFLWAAGSVWLGRLDLVWSPLYIPLALFFLLGLAQYWVRLPLDRFETRQALVLLGADLAFFFLAAQLFARADSRTWRLLGPTVLLFAGSLGLFAILQTASGTAQIYGMVDTPGNLHFGPYVNPNHYAGLMEMLLPVAVLYIVGRRRRSSVGALLLLAVIATVAVTALLLSGSRGGLLALFAETAIVVALLGWGARAAEKRRLSKAVAATILAATLLFSWVDSGRASKHLGLILHVGSPDWVDTSRKNLALDSLRMWRDHLVLGVGMGNFETAYPGYQSLPTDLWIDHSHNDYLEATAETGLVGAVLILSALALFFRLAFQDLRHRLRSEGGWIRLGAAIGCCGLLVHSFFDFNLHIPANAAWFATLAGLATTEEESHPGPLRYSKAA